MKLDKRKKLISIGIAILIVLVTVGIVGALNGWFGGGGKIPEDTFTRGLVSYWSIDEAAGQTAYDASGNSNNGRLGDTTGPDAKDPKWTTGKVGGALSFDGKDDYVNCGNGDSLDMGTSDFTISGWFKTGSTGGDIVQGTDQNANNFLNGYAVVVAGWTGGKLFYGMANGSSRETFGANTVVNDNNWHYFAMVVRRENSVKMYLDGRLDKSSPSSLTGNINLNPSANLNLGRGMWSNYHTGQIDEVRIYKRALSEEESRYHYNRGGPVAQWKFDEGGGTIAYDATDNNNDGTLGGGTSDYMPTWTTGKFGSALSFDGGNDYVNVGKPSSLNNIADAITISAWVIENTHVNYAPIADKNNWFLSSNNSSPYAYYFKIIDVDSGNNYAYMKSAAPLGQWVHIVATWTKGDYLRIYYNGVLDSTSAAILNKSIKSSSSYDLTIGGTNAYFNGTIDDVRIYNYARTADEISLDYNAGFAARFGPTSSCSEDPGSCMTQGLVGYWGMDEGAGTTAYDGSGNSNTGTLTNGPKWTTGKVGGALSFDGLNDYVTVPDSNDWYFGTAGKTVTANGGAQIDTAQSEFGGASGLFDGTGDYLSTPSTADWDFGTGNFTIDFWVYRSGTGGEEAFCGLVSTRDPSANTGWLVAWDEGGNGEIQFNNDGTILLTATETLTMNTWTHVALVRNGNTLTVYYGGVSKGSADITGVSINDDANLGLMIGRRSVDVDSYYHKGWLDEFRTSKGVALWTSNFTPPTVEYVADSYTKLLLHMNGTDASTTFLDGPYDPDFTIDVWLRLNTLQTHTLMLAVQYEDGSHYWDWFIHERPDDYPRLEFDINGATIVNNYMDGASLQTGVWYHLAIVRSGNSWYQFVNGTQIGTTTTSSQAIGNYAGSLLIGDGPYGGYCIDGSLDEFRIYKNRALSAEEIRYHYNHTLPKGALSPTAMKDDPSLVAYWSLNEGSGSTAYDNSNNSNNGTIYGATWSPGLSGNALSFDGVDDYVQIEDNASLHMTTAVTMEAWIKIPSGTTGDHRGVTGGEGDSNWSQGYDLYYDADNNLLKMRLGYGNGEQEGSLYNYYLPYSINLEDNEWHHVAGAFNKPNAYLYVDGVQVNNGTNNNNITNRNSRYNIGALGLSPNWTSDYFSGTIDEVRIYKNRALSAEEIYQHYINSKYYFASHFGPKTSCAEDPGSCMDYGLVGYWAMEEGTGTTAYDASGNNNTGTLTNGPKWTTGKVGGALSFDGVNDYVSVPDSDDWYFGTGDFTIDFWMRRPSATIGWKDFVGQREDWNNMWLIALEDDVWHFIVYSDGVMTIEADPGWTEDVWTGNTWYHIALVRSGASWYWFVNGTQVGSTDTDADAVPDLAGPIYIGGNLGDADLNGSLDEFRIYNRALSAEEIRYHYNRGGPVGYWKLDEGEGTTAYDFTDNNKDCTISGASWVQGQFGSALDFTPNANLSCGNVYNGVKTISFWLRADNLTNYAMDLNGTQTITISSGAISANNFTSPTIYVDGKKSSTLPDLNWHHIAITTSSGINASAVYLGKVSTSYFDGILDDVRFYQYERTLEQILQDYNAGLGIYFK